MKISQSKKIKVSREEGPQILVYSIELKKTNTKAFQNTRIKERSPNLSGRKKSHAYSLLSDE